MSKRTNLNASNGSTKDARAEPGEPAPTSPAANKPLLIHIIEDKQKKLLQADSGHFSMIKMLHLADLITELNGTSIQTMDTKPREYRWEMELS